MATTIDQKVVEMRFDNADFERNTRQSMSTLDKLKAKLNFKGASDGLETIGNSVKKVDMSGLSTGIAACEKKFSALEIAGITALVNITNSAINAGKQLVASFTIDPVKTGWDKMASMMGSVQTLVNSTGKSTDEIEGYLEQLMWYSDETSYSFTDMTSALANMTATGGDIDKLIPMIRGMANATAFAGKGAAEFSRVIYNLNQSYGAGYLTLMDWKSVQLAGANSKQLTQELIRVGEELGKIKKGQVTIGNFNETLKDKWVTTEVMEKAFGRFDKLSAAAYKAYKQGFVEMADGTKVEITSTSEAIELLADGFDELAVKGFRAAQEAKTFREAIEATADATSTAWMNIFRAIFGNYDRQKQIFTEFVNWLYDKFVEPINKFEVKVRNTFDFSDEIESMWNKLTNNSLFKTIDKVNDKIQNTTKTLEEYQRMVDRIWNGDYKNQPYRKGLVENEGWNYEVLQSLVNLGARDKNGNVSWKNPYNGYKITLEDVIYYEQKYGVISSENQQTIEDRTEATKELQKRLENLTEAELKELGLTDEEIGMYQSLQRASKKYGKSMSEIIDMMKNRKGRDLLFGAEDAPGILQNIAAAIGNVFKAIGQAWKEVFVSLGSPEMYMALNNLYEFSVRLKKATEHEKDMRKITDTFKGLFSILKLIKTILGAGFKIAWTVFKTVLETLGYDVLDFTAALGNMISGFVEFITENEFVIKGIEWLTRTIANGIIYVHNWVKNWLSVHDVVSKVTKFLSDFGRGFGKWWQGLKETDNIPKYIFDGLVNGIKEYGGKAIDALGNIAKFMIEKFKQIFGIHSPSTEMFDNGVNIVKGLGNGIWSMAGWIFNIVKELGASIINIVKDMNLGSLLFTVMGIGIIYAVVRIVKAISSIATLAENLSYAVADFGKAAKAIGRGFEIKMIASSVKDFAISLAILVAALAFLATQDMSKIWQGVGVLAVLAVVLAGLTFAASKLGKESKAMLQMAVLMVAFGISLKIMAKALKSLSDIDFGKAWPNLLAFGLLIGSLIAISIIVSHSEKDLIKLGGMFLAIGVCLWLMARVVKTLGKIDTEKLIKGTLAITWFGGIIVGLIAATKLLTGKEKSLAKLGSTLLMIGLCFWLMARVVKTLGKMDTGALIQGMIAITAFAGLIVGLIAATNLIAKGRTAVYKSGSMILAISASLLLMAYTVKMLSKMSIGDFTKGTIFIGIFGAMVWALIWGISKINKEKLVSASSTIIAVAVCIGIMALVAGLLTLLDPGKLTIATVFIAVFSSLAYGLMKVASQIDPKSYKSIWAIVGIIGVMALALGLLSLLDPIKLIGPTIAMSVLFGLLTLLVSQIAKIKTGKTLTKTLGLIMGLIGEIGAILLLLGLLTDPLSVLASAAAIGIVLLALSLSLDKITKIKIKSFSSIGIIMGIIAEIAVIVGLLSILHPKNAIAGAIAISVLLAAIAVSMKSLASIKVKNYSSLVMIMLLLGELMGIMYILSNFNTSMEKALGAIAAMSLLMIVVAGLLLLSDKIPKSSIVGFAIFAVALLAIVGIMALLFIAMAQLKDLGQAVAALIVITVFLVAMTGVVLLLSVVGAGAVGALIGIGVILVLIAAVLGVIAALGALYEYKSIFEQGLEMLELLVVGLGEIIGKFVGAVIVNLADDLSLFAEKLNRPNGFIEVISNIPFSIVKGAGYLALAFAAIAAASFINGIRKIVSALFGGAFSMVGLASDLNAFAEELGKPGGFIDVFKGFPPDVAKGVKHMAEAFLCLSAGAFLNGINEILSFFTGGAFSLEEFGKDISGLGTALSDFVTGLLGPMMTMQLQMVGASKSLGNDTESDNAAAGIDKYVETIVKVIDAGANAIKKLAQAQEALPRRGGLRTTFSGSVQTLNEFADGFKDLAKPLIDFSSSLIEVKFGDNEIKVVSAASEAIKNLAEAADLLPNDGSGILSEWTGRKQTLQAFTAQFPSMADSIIKFTEALTTKPDGTKYDWSADAAEAAKVASDTVKAMAEAAGYVASNTGTMVEETSHQLFGFITLWKDRKETWYEGTETLEEFANHFPAVGEALRRMAMILLGDEYFNASNLDTSVEPYKKNIDDIAKIVPIYTNLLIAIKDLTEVSSNGFFQSEIKELPNSLKNIGPALSAIIKEFKDGTYDSMTGEEFDSLKTKLENAGSVFTIFNSSFDTKNLKSDISSFISASILLTSMNHYTPDFSYIRTVINALKKFVDEDLENVDTEHINDKLSKLGEVFNQFRTNLTSDTYKPLKEFLDGFGKIGQDALAKLQTGFTDELFSTSAGKNLSEGLKSFFNNIITGIETYRKDPTTSINAKGKEVATDLINGYINGLSNSELLKQVYTKAYNISHNYAVQGLKDGENSNSPSKDAMKVGNYLDQGFIIGINELKDKVYDSSFGIGKVATSGLSKSISRIADIVNSDIDTQPTIRPVLDLSNVQDGVNTIGSMFGNKSISLFDNLNSISAGMSNRIQNDNSDVVSAIDKLSKTLSNTPSNTYNINGVTYDDGSNINNAVRDLVRAIEIERRV